MTLYAVLADIHANLPALKAVEKDARNEAKKMREDLRFLCLGDIVDYGPHPNQCVEWILKQDCPCLQGNHEVDVSAGFHQRPTTINPEYWPITFWTRQEVDPAHKQVMKQWNPVMDPLPELPEFTLFHGNLAFGDYFNSVRDGNVAKSSLRAQKTRLGLFAHSHYQGLFKQSWSEQKVEMRLATDQKTHTAPLNDKWSATPLNEWHSVTHEVHKLMINPGSVGQPRHHKFMRDAQIAHDRRAEYLLLCVGSRCQDGLAFQFRRAGYALDKVIDDLQKITWSEKSSGIDESLQHLQAHDMYYNKDYDPQPDSLQKAVARLNDLTHKTVQKILIPTLMNG